MPPGANGSASFSCDAPSGGAGAPNGVGCVVGEGAEAQPAEGAFAAWGDSSSGQRGQQVANRLQRRAVFDAVPDEQRPGLSDEQGDVPVTGKGKPQPRPDDATTPRNVGPLVERSKKRPLARLESTTSSPRRGERQKSRTTKLTSQQAHANNATGSARDWSSRIPRQRRVR
jgi:hypothetical protein